MRTQLGERGLALLRKWEGLRLKAYQDSGGVWTIGYGHTQGVSQGDEVNSLQAEALLRADLAGPVALFCRNDSLSDAQFDALTCFAFNVGSAAYLESTLAHLVNDRRWYEVPAEMMRWQFVKGKRVRGLLRRRLAEATLFCEDEFLV